MIKTYRTPARSGPARVGIVGAGWWSTYTHIPALLAHPQAQWVGLGDTNANRLKAAATAYGIEQVYDQLETMLDRTALDGAIIATPHATRAGLAQTCPRLDLVIRCQLGGLDLDVVSQTLTIHQPDGNPTTFGPTVVPETYPRFSPAYNLVDVILGEAAIGSSAETGWRTVELLAAYRSAAPQGSAVWIKDLYSDEVTQ